MTYIKKMSPILVDADVENYINRHKTFDLVFVGMSIIWSCIIVNGQIKSFLLITNKEIIKLILDHGE